MGNPYGEATFNALWRRVVYDPLLPRLRATEASGGALRWWVRDRRAVLGQSDADDYGHPSWQPLPPPLPPSRLVGREEECAALRDEVLRARLVTIIGAGGVGKTRLALEVAADLQGVFPDGIAWVDLAGVTRPELVATHVASRLGVQQGTVGSFTAGEQQEDRPFVERLAEKLSARRLLLVLASCERLLPGCVELITAVLRTCPFIHVLCTSRLPILLKEEHLLALQPLPVPQQEHPEVEDALTSDAVGLFMNSARADEEVLLSDADLVVAAQICQRVDGVPRAIELAAAKVGTVPLDDILKRLNAVPAVGVTDWSYRLLAATQQLVLRRLSVFRGGFGLDAAAYVCADDNLTPAEVRVTLETLADLSLVQSDPYREPPRYRLHETTRQYALEQLVDAGETVAVRTRHRRWFLGLVEQSESLLYAAEQVETLDLLGVELDNTRSALEFDDAESAAEALRIVCALQRFWVVRGLLSEGRAHLDRALNASASHDASHARALAVASKMADNAGDLDSAKGYAEQARRLARQTGDRSSEALALQQLGIHAYQRGLIAEAERLSGQSLRISRELSDDAGVVVSLNKLGGIASSVGDFGRGRALLQEAVRTGRVTNDVWGLVWSLYWLGRLNSYQGRFDENKECLEEGLLLSRRLGCDQTIVLMLTGMGVAAYLRDDLTAAEGHYLEALAAASYLEDQTSLVLCLAGLADVEIARGDPDAARQLLAGYDPEDPHLRPSARAALMGSHARLAKETGDLPRAEGLYRSALALWYRRLEFRYIPECLENLGSTAAASGLQLRAATLLAAAFTLRSDMGSPVPPVYREQVERAKEGLRQALQRGVRTAWEEGLLMSREEVVAFALSP